MTMRLDKLLADRGVGARRKVKRYVKGGRVTVNGVVCREHGRHVAETDAVAFDEQPVVALPVVAKWHKPKGIITTTSDPWGRLSLADTNTSELFEDRYHPVGRLDLETSGLLLFSRDGGLTHRLLHPKQGVERTYRARVENAPTEELFEVLAAGVETAAGVFTAKVHAVEGDVVELTVTEGKHRMVRRMLNNAGHPVLDLHRLRYGAVELGDLAEGEWAGLEGDELAWVETLLR
jgi:23S rRNA pseudouridine2605 synthase